MENTFRRAVVGGFNRQDVTEYITRTAKEHHERIEQMERENEELRTQLSGKAELEETLETMRRSYEDIAQELAQTKAACEEYVRQLRENAVKIAKLDQFQRESEEYSGVKGHLAEIELEAHRRADEMLSDAKAQADIVTQEAEQKANETRRAAAQELQELYEQYQRLTGAFQTAAAHVTEELRRMDVAVGQLPLAFDKARSRLEKLKEQKE